MRTVVQACGAAWMGEAPYQVRLETKSRSALLQTDVQQSCSRSHFQPRNQVLILREGQCALLHVYGPSECGYQYW